jgi:hypothetical protein
MPMAYRVKYCLHPADLDQYPPGLPVPTGFRVYPSQCRSNPPMPTHPYADPEGYYGIPILPREEAASEKK